MAPTRPFSQNRIRNGILCVATQGIDGIKPCVDRDDHLTTCEDTSCKGCGLRLADRGYLCYPHWKRVDEALIFWATWVEEIKKLDGAPAVSPSEMRVDSTRTDFDPTNRVEEVKQAAERFFPAEEVETGYEWVLTEDGAREAIQFALYAERAFRAIEVVEREGTKGEVECPSCGKDKTTRIPPSWNGDELTFRCDTPGCGRVLDQDTFEALNERDMFQFGCKNCDWKSNERTDRSVARAERDEHVLRAHEQTRTA